MTATQLRSDPAGPSLPVTRYEADIPYTAGSEIAWGAVVAGGTIGWAFQIWLAMLGVAIGASTIDPLRESMPMNGIGVGSAVWVTFTVLVASLIGGTVTGYASRKSTRVDSLLHGALTWAGSTLATFVIMGVLVGGIFNNSTRVAAAVSANETQRMGSEQTMQDQAGETFQDLTRSAGDSRDNRRLQDNAARAVSGSSFAMVAIMLLGLCAGIAGTMLGTRRRRQMHARPI